jgi:hypothetical protein
MASPKNDTNHRKRKGLSFEKQVDPNLSNTKKSKTKHKDYKNDTPTDSTNVAVLEGAMVDDHDQQQQIMVLVDKKNGIVYSTVEPPLPDGSRQKIGVWKNGKIQLFPKPVLLDNAQDESGKDPGT